MAAAACYQQESRTDSSRSANQIPHHYQRSESEVINDPTKSNMETRVAREGVRGVRGALEELPSAKQELREETEIGTNTV